MIHRLFPILAILFALALIIFYIYPTWTGPITAAKQQIASYQSALTASATFTQKENQLIAERNAIPAESLTRLATYLPDNINNIQLILDVTALAQRSGVTLSNFNVTNDSAGAASTGGDGAVIQSTNPYDSLTLSVSAVGTYSAFRTFLAALEQSLTPIDVTSLQLTSSATGVYTYNMSFRVYWLH